MVGRSGRLAGGWSVGVGRLVGRLIGKGEVDRVGTLLMVGSTRKKVGMHVGRYVWLICM